MTAEVLSLSPGGVDVGGRSQRGGWIESAWFDVVFFMLAPLSGLVFLLFSYYQPTRYLTAGVFFAVGMAHYLSTFSFFLGDDNFHHYRAHAAAFFGGPLLILLLAGYSRFFVGLPVLLSAIYVWNVYHVALQNCGILSLYRHLAERPGGEKLFVNSVVITSSFALALWYIDRFDPLHQLLTKTVPQYGVVLRFSLGGATALAFLAYAIHVSRQSRPHHAPTRVEALFILSSLLMFSPYLWVGNIELATGGMLFGHFIQYLGLVWLVHRRKYGRLQPGTTGQRFLGVLSRNLPLLVAFLFFCVVLVYSFDRVTRVLRMQQVYYWLWNSLALTHFYLDGLIWSFKRPYVRESMGPYLSKAFSSPAT